MNEPVWIELRDCYAFHAMLLDRFGGLDGIRDEGLLDSALHRPRQHAAYETLDLFALAASYAHGIIKNHPFTDGNKRAGFITAALFLEINGCIFQAPEEEVVLKTFALAAGEIGEKEYAAWLEKSCAAR